MKLKAKEWFFEVACSIMINDNIVKRKKWYIFETFNIWFKKKHIKCDYLTVSNTKATQRFYHLIVFD